MYLFIQCSYFFPDPQADAVPHCRQSEGAYPGLFRLMRDFFIGQVRRCLLEQRWREKRRCMRLIRCAQIDNGKFEDECRLLLGTNSYELFTLDKVRYPFSSPSFSQPFLPFLLPPCHTPSGPRQISQPRSIHVPDRRCRTSAVFAQRVRVDESFWIFSRSAALQCAEYMRAG